MTYARFCDLDGTESVACSISTGVKNTCIHVDTSPFKKYMFKDDLNKTCICNIKLIGEIGFNKNSIV